MYFFDSKCSMKICKNLYSSSTQQWRLVPSGIYTSHTQAMPPALEYITIVYITTSGIAQYWYVVVDWFTSGCVRPNRAAIVTAAHSTGQLWRVAGRVIISDVKPRTYASFIQGHIIYSLSDLTYFDTWRTFSDSMHIMSLSYDRFVEISSIFGRMTGFK